MAAEVAEAVAGLDGGAGLELEAAVALGRSLAGGELEATGEGAGAGGVLGDGDAFEVALAAGDGDGAGFRLAVVEVQRGGQADDEFVALLVEFDLRLAPREVGEADVEGGVNWIQPSVQPMSPTSG